MVVQDHQTLHGWIQIGHRGGNRELRVNIQDCDVVRCKPNNLLSRNTGYRTYLLRSDSQTALNTLGGHTFEPKLTCAHSTYPQILWHNAAQLHWSGWQVTRGCEGNETAYGLARHTEATLWTYEGPRKRSFATMGGQSKKNLTKINQKNLSLFQPVWLNPYWISTKEF